MSSEEEEFDEVWREFHKKVSTVMAELNQERPSHAAVRALCAIEEVLITKHHAPPGFICASLQFNREDFEPWELIEHLATAEPDFSICPAALFMGVPQELQDEALETIKEAWSVISLGVDLWVNVLSEFEKKQSVAVAHGFKVCFLATCYLRNYGLWHHASKSERAVNRGVEPVDQWSSFSSDEALCEVVRSSKGLQSFNDFNMNNGWQAE